MVNLIVYLTVNLGLLLEDQLTPRQTLDIAPLDLPDYIPPTLDELMADMEIPDPTGPLWNHDPDGVWRLP